MTLLHAYLCQSNTRWTLSKKPGEKGFSLIELVVVIAVLAVLTAIALPNFLGVSEDASARTAQQAALNAFKECKVKWARNKRGASEEFSVPAITDWAIASGGPEASSAKFSLPVNRGSAQPDTGSTAVRCFDNDENSKDIYAIPPSKKFPSFKVSADGKRHCYTGQTGLGEETFNIGCNSDKDDTYVLGWE